MARALLVGTGVVATVAGAVLLVGGGAIATTFGTDGRVSTEPATVVGTGVAVLVEGFTVDAVGLPVPDGVGILSLSATAPDGSQVFLGTARDDDLDTYLTGAPYDVVASLSPGATAVTRPVPGTLRPQPPTDADLWVTSAVGAPARLPARVPDGTTLVVMRPDADQGVQAALVVTLEVDRAWPAALIALGAGLVLLVLGLVLLVLGLRRRPVGAHTAVPATSTAPPPATVAVAPEADPVAAGPEEVPDGTAVRPDEPTTPAEATTAVEDEAAADDQPVAETGAVVGDEAEAEDASEPVAEPPTEAEVETDAVSTAAAADALGDAPDAAPTDAVGSGPQGA